MLSIAKDRPQRQQTRGHRWQMLDCVGSLPPTMGITSKLLEPWWAPYLPWKARSNCSWKHYGRMTFLPSDSWIYLAQGTLETVSTGTYMDNKMWIIFSCCLFAVLSEVCCSQGTTRHSGPRGCRAALPWCLLESTWKGPSCLALTGRLSSAQARTWPRHKPSLFQIAACCCERHSRKHLDLVWCLFLNKEQWAYCYVCPIIPS